MPRIRTIKPEFWSDEKLSTLNVLDRLTFLGLISLADDFGRVHDNVKVIDAFVFPNTDETVRESLANLSRMNRIKRGNAASGMAIIEIINWDKHQKVDKPQTRSALPPIETQDKNAFENHSRISREQVEAVSGLVANDSDVVRDLTTDHRPPTMDHGSGTDDHGPGMTGAIAQCVLFDPPVNNGPVHDTPEMVCQYWNAMMDQKRELTPKRKAKLQSRLKNSKWREGWRAAIDKAALSDFCHGAGDRGWVASLDWFGDPDTVTKLLEGEYDNREKSGYHLTDAQKKLHNSELAGQNFLEKMGGLANTNGKVLGNGSK